MLSVRDYTVKSVELYLLFEESGEEEQGMEQKILPPASKLPISLISTYFRCYDIDTSLQRQIINIKN